MTEQKEVVWRKARHRLPEIEFRIPKGTPIHPELVKNCKVGSRSADLLVDRHHHVIVKLPNGDVTVWCGSLKSLGYEEVSE